MSGSHRNSLSEIGQRDQWLNSTVLAPLITQRNWCIWRYVDGKKVPYQSLHPTRCARTNDPKTWSSYEEAVAAAPPDGGIGFMLLGSGIGALDLDDCRNAETGQLDDWARG